MSRLGVHFNGVVQRWEKKWVKEQNAPIPVFKWAPLGTDTRTVLEKTQGRRKYVPVTVNRVELEGLLPPPGAGLATEKQQAPVVELQEEAPRRSLRARTDRVYTDGDDEAMSDSDGDGAGVTDV